MKTCSKCKEIKELTLFPIDKNTKSGYRSDCKSCHLKSYHANKIKNNTANKRKVYRKNNLQLCRKQSLDWYYNNKDTGKNARLKRMYGITLEDHDNILKAQDYKCAVCKTDNPSGTGKQFNVDHCHKTGIVRGLLCWNCNISIGYFKENLDSMKSAIEYLTRFLPSS